MIKKFNALFYYLFKYPYYKLIFKRMGGRSRIISPLALDCPHNISIGERVVIQYKTWLAAVPLTGNSNCALIIDDGAIIGNFNHIYATSKIHIGKNVLTADKVYISDNLHSYEDIAVPVSRQPIKQISEVYVGEGSWLGENVCVIGAKIGKGCVIGANSVVTRDIPDFCVAVGSPARIVKRYSAANNEWIKEN